MEPWREERRLGEDAGGVHFVLGVLLHVGEVVADAGCVGEEGCAVEVAGAEDRGRLHVRGEEGGCEEWGEQHG